MVLVLIPFSRLLRPTLGLNGHRIGDSSATFLSQALAANPSLTISFWKVRKRRRKN